eukprot:CAMPEP_0119190076 /NCGR_PEP_ID=MMETSP1316-20130426/1236_1 /TAXON_ID=41880 /ORGANISM="Pycnococcus provasolii, Strain RCC2336" /LENGTH=610 /DNA_ID=CAMNT_0007184855 /DNA_START=20 /DNA_END=1852 /DNA_ORIENTATION=+
MSSSGLSSFGLAGMRRGGGGGGGGGGSGGDNAATPSSAATPPPSTTSQQQQSSSMMMSGGGGDATQSKWRFRMMSPTASRKNSKEEEDKKKKLGDAATTLLKSDSLGLPNPDDHTCLGPECFGNVVIDDDIVEDVIKKKDGAQVMYRKLRAAVRARDAEQTEYLQAFDEITRDLLPVFEKEPHYAAVLETIAEPEQCHIFRVSWLDDNGRQQVNRGYRVQFSSALGPYKGGLRFHPTVNLSICKFLGFEQIFKNALTGLPIGGGKGGSDFDPKGRSDAEILRFCQSMAIALTHHIGPNVDVPAGDIGVGAREIGYMYGQYKRITRSFEGAFTGKDPKWGGSLLRPEATGYGVVYFAKCMLAKKSMTMQDMRCVVSGSGNVAIYCVEKLLELGAHVLTMSDSTGFLYVPDGFTKELVDIVRAIKMTRGRSLREVLDCGCVGFQSVEFHDDDKNINESTHHHPHRKRPWGFVQDVDLVFPCATQNEIDAEDASAIISSMKMHGARCVVEGANMPSTIGAVEEFERANVAFGPSKAANAGGVAVSALEMAQNSMRMQWTREEVDEKLVGIMNRIFATCDDTAREWGMPGLYRVGANIAAFLKVANSVVEQGVV